MKKTIITLVTLLFSVVICYAVPVYEFYAHKNRVPMPFWGNMPIPKHTPHVNQLYDPNYAFAAEESLLLIIKRQQKINAPAISVAVAIDNSIVWAGASGWADIKGDIPAKTNTQFRIGSTSKALTSAGLAILLADKKLTLDTPLSDILTTLPNPKWADITPRHLASHMSGLPHYKDNTDNLGLYKTISLSTHYNNVQDSLSIFDQSEMLFAPGEEFSYSTFGTVLLSAILQQAAGQPFQELMHSRIFTPLGMENTLPEPEFHNKPNIAKFYWNNGGENLHVREWRKVDLSHRLAGGGFLSTPTDLVKFGISFLDSDFIPESVRTTLWTPQSLHSGSINEQNYALGWRFHQRDFGKEIGELGYAHHGGVSRGSQSWLMVIPEYKMALSININSNTKHFSDFASVSTEIVQLFIKAKISKSQGIYTHLKSLSP